MVWGECEVEEKHSFRRSLSKLDDETSRRVREAIRILRRKPFSGKPLRGRLRNLWRYRVGRYRIVYLPQPCHIIFILIGHRETVYS